MVTLVASLILTVAVRRTTVTVVVAALAGARVCATLSRREIATMVIAAGSAIKQAMISC